MAEIKTTSVADMTDADLADETKQFFMFWSARYAIENGVIADDRNVTLQERCFISCRFQTVNDRNARVKERVSPWAQLTLANFPAFVTQAAVDAFFDGLKIIFDRQRADAGLIP